MDYITLRALPTLLLSLLVLVSSGAAQDEPDEVAQLLSRTVGDPKWKKSDVLLLGTFHFADAGLDAYKPQHRIDVFSAGKQQEIADLVDRLAKFRPTRIGVEWPAAKQEQLDERYAKYRAGELELGANERDQIGLRLAKQLGLQRVHAIDAQGAWLEPRSDPEAWAKEHGQKRYLQDPYQLAYVEAMQFLDELKTKKSLLETLLFYNDPRLIEAGHGAYLGPVVAVGDADDYPGVDGFRSQWYNRNLRIFANVRRLTEEPGERVLVIIGAGHLPILRHAVAAAPDYRLVEPADHLR